MCGCELFVYTSTVELLGLILSPTSGTNPPTTDSLVGRSTYTFYLTGCRKTHVQGGEEKIKEFNLILVHLRTVGSNHLPPQMSNRTVQRELKEDPGTYSPRL